MTSLHDPPFHSAGAKLVVRHIFAINFSLQNIYYRNLLDLYYDFAILRHITLFLLFHFSFRTLLYYYKLHITTIICLSLVMFTE